MSESANKEVVIRMSPWAAGILSSVIATMAVAALFGIFTTRDLARSTDQLARSNQSVITAYGAELAELKQRVAQAESRISVVEDRTDRASKRGTSYIFPRPQPRPVPVSARPDRIANKRDDAPHPVRITAL